MVKDYKMLLPVSLTSFLLYKLIVYKKQKKKKRSPASFRWVLSDLGPLDRLVRGYPTTSGCLAQRDAEEDGRGVADSPGRVGGGSGRRRDVPFRNEVMKIRML